ncbi:MAG: SRPBCC family protein [Egibacteraceae bacterium]
MLIENEFEVAAPIEQVWQYLLDVPRLAPCMPGAELTEVIGDDEFKGRVTAKMGPVSLRFAGTAKIVERDAVARRIVINATGSEEKGKGQASMLVTSTLMPSGTGTTRVKVAQNLTISGALAQYGRGMISDVTKVLMGSFADCLQENIARASRGEAAQATAAPVKGFSVGVKAFLMALKRLFGRGKTA